MSLDISLKSSTPKDVECPHCGAMNLEHEYLFSINITHNLGKMAGEAGIYKALWRPEELNVSTAGELIDSLEKGLALLKSDPERFKRFNAENGWGLYEHFVPFVEECLEAYKKYPDAIIEVSR